MMIDPQYGKDLDCVREFTLNWVSQVLQPVGPKDRSLMSRISLKLEARLLRWLGQAKRRRASKPQHGNQIAKGGNVDASDQRKVRHAFIAPLLEQKGWSVLDWAGAAHVDGKTPTNYLMAKTRLYPSTRKKLADALGVPADQLP